MQLKHVFRTTPHSRIWRMNPDALALSIASTAQLLTATITLAPIMSVGLLSVGMGFAKNLLKREYSLPKTEPLGNAYVLIGSTPHLLFLL